MLLDFSGVKTKPTLGSWFEIVLLNFPAPLGVFFVFSRFLSLPFQRIVNCTSSDRFKPVQWSFWADVCQKPTGCDLLTYGVGPLCFELLSACSGSGGVLHIYIYICVYLYIYIYMYIYKNIRDTTLIDV